MTAIAEQITLDLYRSWTPEEAAAVIGVDWSRPEVENNPCGAWAVWNDAFREAERLGLVEVRHCQRHTDGSVSYTSEAERAEFWSLSPAERKKHPRRKVFQWEEGGTSWCEWRRIA